jgi:restriction endonuclease S subunit
VGWGKVETRLDCTYFRARRRFDRLKFGETERLGRLLKGFFSGGTPLTTNEDFWVGDLPWASPKDFNGAFYISDTIDHISPSALMSSAAKKAEANTVLMVVRSGVLAHSLPVAVTTQPMAINQDLKAMVPHDRLRADYLAAFLSIFADDVLPIVTKHGVTVQSVNSPELLALPVPVPDLAVQESIASMLIAAHEQRDARFSEAAALLASIDDYLLSELGIVLPPETENTLANRTFRVAAHELGGWRFDPHALHPDVEACRDAIERFGKFAHLRAVVSFSRDQVAGRQEPLPYVGLEHVQGGTGILLDAEYDDDFGTALVFSPGQVLFPKLRPYLNKVYLADVRGYCSTEFHVLQAKSVKADFLALLLRSEITVRQTKHLMTGNTLPRLQTRDIEQLPIPLPDEATQNRIVAFATKIQAQAEKLTQSATAELESAKHDIEAILMGAAA